MRHRIVIGFSCAVLSVAAPFATKAAGARVPFVLYRGYTIVVHGSIGRIMRLNFIVDTGAVPSIVDRRQGGTGILPV